MSRPKSNEMDLTVGNPFWSLFWEIAIPVILGNLFQLFYTLADSVIVGKTLGADSLAAVGATIIIIYFVFCFINGFTGGFGICLGQRCSAKKRQKGMKKCRRIHFSVLFDRADSDHCLLAHQFSDGCRSRMAYLRRLMIICSWSFSERALLFFTI